MSNFIKSAIASLPILSLVTAIPGYGFVLTNNDTITYAVEIIEDQNPDTTHEIELYEGDVIEDLCKQGCLVSINGQEYSFSGYEVMVIEGGELIEAPAQ